MDRPACERAQVADENVTDEPLVDARLADMPRVALEPIRRTPPSVPRLPLPQVSSLPEAAKARRVPASRERTPSPTAGTTPGRVSVLRDLWEQSRCRSPRDSAGNSRLQLSCRSVPANRSRSLSAGKEALPLRSLGASWPPPAGCISKECSKSGITRYMERSMEFTELRNVFEEDRKRSAKLQDATMTAQCP